MKKKKRLNKKTNEENYVELIILFWADVETGSFNII